VIDASMAQLREAIKGNEAATIEAVTKTLANDTEAFAAQRMNAGIARALAGRKVESL
jgi:molecular chaperone HscA